MEESHLSSDFETKVWPAYQARSKSTGKTQANLHLFLKQFSDFAKKDVLVMQAEDAKVYTEHLYEAIRKGKRKGSYVKVMLLSLRKFYTFLIEYRYEFGDRGITVPKHNPFEGVVIGIPDKVELTSEDLPSLSDLDALLEASANTNQSLFLAISLAAKVGLSISEISNLSPSMVGYMRDEQNFQAVTGTSKKHLYICLNAIGEHGRTKRYLQVPEDIEELLNLDLTSDFNTTNPYLITYKGKHYSERTMQYHLKELCQQIGLKQITFADLRNLAIFLMKEGGASTQEIAKYTGQEGRWISRFSGVSASKIFNAASYSRINIRTRGNDI